MMIFFKFKNITITYYFTFQNRSCLRTVVKANFCVFSHREQEKQSNNEDILSSRSWEYIRQMNET